MNIRTAKFIKGAIGSDEVLEDGKPQIAFIGRSNVGKSSVINSLVKKREFAQKKELARTSAYPGRTQEINLFLINNSFYLVDLPGYGFAKMPKEKREWIEKRTNWYFFDSKYKIKKIVIIIDANVGLTTDDLRMLYTLEENEKDIVVIANKVDKIRKSAYKNQLQKIQETVGKHKVIPYSAKKGIGINALLSEIL